MTLLPDLKINATVSEGIRIADLGMRNADLALRHMAAPSLGHYASLSFVVIGSGQRIGDRSRGKKKGIFLWERLSAAILRFERLQRLERFTFYRFLQAPDSWLLDSLIIE